MHIQIFVILITGIVCLISGVTMIALHLFHSIVSVMMVSLGTSLITVCLINRKATVCDEMVKKADALSGYYAYITTLYLIFILAIANFFFPLPLSISGFMLVLMLFMSVTAIGLRHFFLKRGVSE